MPQGSRRFHLITLSSLLLAILLGTTGCRVKANLAAAESNHRPNSSSLPEEVSSASQSRLSGHATYLEPWGTAHVVRLSLTDISVVTADSLQSINTFAEQENAAYTINAGFFDPQNGKTTSHLIVQGQVVGDPTTNERLTENPTLSPYLEQIFNRSEFRAYRCDAEDVLRYDITFHNQAVPAGCTIESAVGAGPQLLPQDTSEIEAFTDYQDGKLIRDAIGSMQPNARSAIGLSDRDEVYLIMIEKNADSLGLTLSELADFAASLGITKLLNLDGGSSSALYVANDDTYFGRSDADGTPIERPIKSVILAK